MQDSVGGLDRLREAPEAGYRDDCYQHDADPEGQPQSLSNFPVVEHDVFNAPDEG
jgi:hypothetical protein